VWRLHPWALSLASILVLPARFRSAGVGQAATGLQDGVVLQPGPQHLLEGGVDLGVQAPDPVSALVDLAGQVQVESREHRQGGRVLVRGVDGSQGVGHAPGRAGDDGSVLGVGLGAARRQVGDASHRQSGQVAHGDAHVLGHCHGQGPDGGRLVDWWQAGRPPPAPAPLPAGAGRPHATGPRRWAGPCRGSSGPPGSGQWPSARSYRRPVPMKTSISPISISPAASRCMGAGPAGGRPVPHPRYERPHTQRAVPLISGHQRPAAAGDNTPRIIYGQGQDIMPTAIGPAPDHPGPPIR